MSRTIKHCIRLILFPALLALLLASGLSVFVASTRVTHAQALEKSSISQPVQLDSPAIVRILSVVYGKVICYACASDGSNVVSPQSNYFAWASSGSGVFVSPDGYILTADHVVDHNVSNPGDIDYLLNAAANDIASRYNTTPNNVLQVLQNQNNQGNLGVDIQVQNQSVFLSTSYTGQLQNTAQMISYPLTRIVASSPVAKQDTAIIQVEAHDMPFLNLAQNSTINIGDTVTAIGYPGDADCVVNNCNFTALLTPSQSDATTLGSLLDLSASSGQITSQKNWSDGTPVYVVGGEIASAGSSGGPVIDQQGNIIGFVDAAPANNRITFVVPSSVIQSYMQQAGISNPRGKFMSLWTQAINDYSGSAACHWTNASKELSALHNNYPQFGAVLPLSQNAQAKATPTECPAPVSSRSFNIVTLLIGVVAGAILIALLLIFFSRRRRQPSVQAIAANGHTPVPVSISSPVLAQSHSQPLPYQAAGSTGYGHGSNVWQDSFNTHGPTYLASQGPTAPITPTPVVNLVQSPTPVKAFPSFPSLQSPTPVRQCTSGHLISERDARFCPHCGSMVHDIPVR